MEGKLTPTTIDLCYGSSEDLKERLSDIQSVKVFEYEISGNNYPGDHRSSFTGRPETVGKAI